MELPQEPTRRDVCELAYALGQLLTDVGDFYDVAANLAIGWRDAQMATGEKDAPLPAYTGRGQIERMAAAGPGPNSRAGQARSSQTTKEHWRLILGALNELQSVANNTLASSVGDARADGLVWSEIGDALEISKQGAQKRFGTPPHVFANESDA